MKRETTPKQGRIYYVELAEDCEIVDDCLNTLTIRRGQVDSTVAKPWWIANTLAEVTDY